MNFLEFLKDNEACQDMVDWAYGKSLKQFWEECPEAEWLIWLAIKVRIPKPKIVGVAAQCASLVKDLMPNKDSRDFLDVCRMYSEGKETHEQFLESSKLADAAYVYIAVFDSSLAGMTAWISCACNFKCDSVIENTIKVLATTKSKLYFNLDEIERKDWPPAYLAETVLANAECTDLIKKAIKFEEIEERFNI